MEELRSILRKARQEDLEALFQILGLQRLQLSWDDIRRRSSLQEVVPSPDSIVDGFRSLSCNVFYGLNFPNYRATLGGVAALTGAKICSNDSAQAAELKIVRHLCDQAWDCLPDDQKEDFSSSLVAPAGAFVALTAAQASGFGVYMLASSALGVATSTIGATLPFVIYTSMSKLISIAIGPVGWVLAGIWSLVQINESFEVNRTRELQSNIRRLSLGVLCIFRIRGEVRET